MIRGIDSSGRGGSRFGVGFGFFFVIGGGRLVRLLLLLLLLVVGGLFSLLILLIIGGVWLVVGYFELNFNCCCSFGLKLILKLCEGVK